MAFIAALLLPTIFVIAANFWGLNTIIKEVAIRNSVPHANLMPLTFEYFIFAVLFILINLMSYGVNCLGDFSLSSFFLGIIGMLYTIDNLYPTGQFTPFQILVPATATLSANLLGFLGYQPIWLSANQGMPTLMVMDSQRRFSCAFSIAWPCAGVESLILYTITILLFLNKIVTSRWQRVIYFAIGAAITYFINILRIATIFIISIPCGATNEWVRFHNIYGSLYSITWITAFPLIIMGSQALWKTFRKRKTGPTTTSNLKIS
jgi:thaumarchaeosortase